jgi:predicted MFS family arabinose efflux permease
MVTGAVGSFVVLVLARMGVAAAESGGNPTSISLIGDYFEPKERATAVGVFYANNAIAMFLVFSLAGYVAAEYGWRTAFLLAGVPGLVLSVVILLTLPEPQRGALDGIEQPETEVRPKLREIVKVMLGDQTLLLLTAGAVLHVAGQAGITAFVAPFFIRMHDLPLAQAGLVTGAIIGGASLVGAAAGGVVADRMERKAAGGGCYFVSTVIALAALFAIAGLALPDLWLAVGFLFLYVGFASSFCGGTFATIFEAAPGHMRGAISAYVMLAMNLGG